MAGIFFQISAILVVACNAQKATIDPSLLVDVFGTPDATTPTNKPTTTATASPAVVDVFGTPATKYEDITVRPTEGTVTGTDANGATCQCVPYYLCDDKNMRIEDETAITGAGLLDIRFGEDQPCTETVELCCTIVNKNATRPQPDPTKLRGCGYRNPNGIGIKLTGGTGGESEYGEFPWVVAILDTSNKDKYIGVGVIIHPQVVMTASHVVNKFGPGVVKIRAGEWDTQTLKEAFEHQERLVDEIYVHDNLGKLLQNDIALMRLASPLDLGEHINMLCLPEQGEIFDDSKRCVSNGWGKNNFGLKGRYAVIMKKVEQDMVPYDRCNQLLKQTRLTSRFNLPQTLVCAGGEAGIDTCTGDGGGPLACPIGDDRYKLTGLVAWGIDCGKKDVPAVFAQVSAFRNWIDDKMNEWGYGTSSYSIE